MRVVGVDLAIDDLVALLSGARPDAVIHCAALTDVDACEARPAEAERENVVVTARIAAAAASAGAFLAYISTDSVFDGTRGGYGEDEAAVPVNVYGRTKLAGEAAVRAAIAPDRWLVARTAIYGWNALQKRSLAEFFLARLEAQEPVSGFADSIFTPILVDDLAEALLELIAAGAAGLFHVAGSEAVTKLEFGRRVAATFGFDPSSVTPSHRAAAKQIAPRPRDVSLRTSKVASALGRRMPNVDEGLMRFRALREAGFSSRLREIASLP